MRSVDARGGKLFNGGESGSPFSDDVWTIPGPENNPGRDAHDLGRPPSGHGPDTPPLPPAGPHADDAPPTGPDAPEGLILLGAIDSAAVTGAGGGTGGTGPAPAPATGTVASPFVINITWDASVSSAPAGFMPGVMNAVNYLQQNYTDAVTININVGYGVVGGSPMGGALGTSQTYLASMSYATLYNALAADVTTASDSSAVASLPASAPITGSFLTSTAEAKALGLMAPNGSGIDGNVGFASAYAFDYDNSDGVAAGTYDFNAVVLHELTEVMGRILLTGATLGSTTNYYDPLDLFHYSSVGVRDFVGSTPGYFSINSGAANLRSFNTVSGGDAGDWASGAGPDAANAFSSSGVIGPFSEADLVAMDVIGWNRAASAPPTPTGPTGVNTTPVTSALAAAQGANGLNANAALIQASQVGGTLGDAFTYTLGGTGVSAFGLTATGLLSAGASGAAGAVNGRLYGLTVTANDTTLNKSSPAVPVNVIVGSSNADVVSISTLSGALGLATPTFAYGLAGNDQLNGTGMTGKLRLAGGAGADRMTGGSGPNSYLYGAASESTASLMDVITNFHASVDTIDLTGLNSALNYVGKLSTNSLAAHSVGYQNSGGHTYVYVNTSGGSERLSVTNMKIDLQGTMALSSGNILHV